jgi:nucleoside-diphosphate-sugar epimerase
MPHYLVTGGCGFIGSHLVEALVKKGERVRVFDNCSTGGAESLAAVMDKIELMNADLRDMEAVRKAVAGVDYVLHQAALPSVPKSIEHPILNNEVNITGALHALIASRDEGVKRFVFAASSSAYGNLPGLPKSEDQIPAPASPYAVAKYTGECYCKIFTEIYGLETVSLRYFNIFGPRQDPTSQYSAVIARFIDAYKRGEPPKIEGDGEQTRDFTYVANVVEANLLACHVTGVAGELFNIGCGVQTTINQLAALIGEMMQSDLKPVHVAPRPGDVRHSLADISKARRMLGYEPKVDLKTGLRHTVDWFVQQYKRE